MQYKGMQYIHDDQANPSENLSVMGCSPHKTYLTLASLSVLHDPIYTHTPCNTQLTHQLVAQVVGVSMAACEVTIALIWQNGSSGITLSGLPKDTTEIIAQFADKEQCPELTKIRDTEGGTTLTIIQKVYIPLLFPLSRWIQTQPRIQMRRFIITKS